MDVIYLMLLTHLSCCSNVMRAPMMLHTVSFVLIYSCTVVQRFVCGFMIAYCCTTFNGTRTQMTENPCHSCMLHFTQVNKCRTFRIASSSIRFALVFSLAVAHNFNCILACTSINFACFNVICIHKM